MRLTECLTFPELVVEDNVDVAARLAKKALPEVEYFEIEHPTEGFCEYIYIIMYTCMIDPYMYTL